MDQETIFFLHFYHRKPLCTNIWVVLTLHMASQNCQPVEVTVKTVTVGNPDSLTVFAVAQTVSHTTMYDLLNESDDFPPPYWQFCVKSLQ